VPGTAHVLRVSLHLKIMKVKASPKPSLMEAGRRREATVSCYHNGVPVTVLRKAVVPPRRSSTKVRGDVQESRQACIVGRAF
ncbi:hypothetical protein, partial [Desulfocicer niacini]